MKKKMKKKRMQVSLSAMRIAEEEEERRAIKEGKNAKKELMYIPKTTLAIKGPS